MKDFRGQNLKLVSEVNFKDPYSAVAFATECFESSLRDRRSREAVWMTILSYYLSKMFAEYDPAKHAVLDPRRPHDHIVRYAENMFAPYVRNNISQLTSNDPAAQVRPVTSDPDDWSVAQVSSKVVRSWWQTRALKRKNQEFLLWGKLTGNVFLRPYWDEFAGELLAEDDPEIVGEPPITEMQQPSSMQGPTGGRLGGFFQQIQNVVRSGDPNKRILPTGEGRFIRLGDICFEEVSPFYIFPDPAGSSVETCRWIIDARYRTLDWIRGRYPGKGKEIAEERSRTREGVRFADQVKSLYRGLHEADQIPRALVMDVYIQPCPQYPMGLHYVVAGEKVLQPAKPLETRLHGKPCIPLFHFRDKIVPGEFWASCILEDGLQPQTLYNRAMSQQLESANLTANPVVLNPNNSGLKKGQATNAPGSFWNYTPKDGVKPEYMQPPSLPQYAQDLPDRLRAGFENVVSQHEVSQGQAPANTRTGVALAFLAEKDQASNSLAAEEMRTVWSQAMSCGLELFADKVGDEPRLAKITGRGGEDLDIFEFTGKDLRSKNSRLPGATAFDVEMDFLSQLPKSKAAMQEQVFRGLESGLLDVMNPEERKLARKWAGFAVPEDMDVQREAEAQQHVELRIMLGDDPMQAQIVATRTNIWDDHIAHATVLKRFLRRPEVLTMPPDKRGLLIAHLQLHEMQAMMQMAPAAGPAPAPGMSPEPPISPPMPIGGTMVPQAPDGVPGGDPRSSVPATPVDFDSPRALPSA